MMLIMMTIDRMQLIIPPEQAKTFKTKARKLGKRRDAGKLKNFVDLPLDIIYEVSILLFQLYMTLTALKVVSYLNPLELLTLGRLTKEFRALFMSRSSVAIWRRVLRHVSGLPPCPRDLTEPQYASFMFEKFCMVYFILVLRQIVSNPVDPEGLWKHQRLDHNRIQPSIKILCQMQEKQVCLFSESTTFSSDYLIPQHNRWVPSPAKTFL